MHNENIKLEIFRGIDGFVALHAIWVKKTDYPAHYFYDLPQWHNAHIHYRYAGINLQENGQANILYALFKINNQPAAIFPLQISSKNIHGIPLTVLHFFIEDYFDMMDIIVLDDAIYNTNLSVLINMIKQSCEEKIDACYFKGTPTLGNIDKFLDSKDVKFTRYSHHYSRFVNTQSDKTFTDSLPGKFKRNLRRQLKNISQLGEITTESATSWQDIEAYFENFSDIEVRGWKGKYKRATAFKKNSHEYLFYKNLIQELSQDNKAQLNVLKLNNDVLAVQICIVTDDVLHITKITYDEDYARYSPGNLLMHQVLLDACYNKNINRVNFITDYHWNNLWAAEYLTINRVIIYNSTARGILAGMAGSITMFLRSAKRKFS